MLNSPLAPVKSRFQIAWPGSLSSAGCSTRDLRTCAEPARHLQRRALMMRKPHRQRAQATQRQKDVIGPGADPEQPDALGNERPGAGVGRDRSEHDVGMTADVLGGGLGADVDALVERAMKQGVAQVLSSITSASRACATSAMAGMSAISNDCDPGASTITARVFGRNRSPIRSPIRGSK